MSAEQQEEAAERELTLSPTFTMSVEELAEELVRAGQHDHEALMELVLDLDQSVGEWAFTVKLVRRLLEVLVPLADVESSVLLAIQTKALMGVLDHVINEKYS